LAPEMLYLKFVKGSKSKYNWEIDWYSLGVTIYQMATRKLPVRDNFGKNVN
jgi:serine/threonine protein kinase